MWWNKDKCEFLVADRRWLRSSVTYSQFRTLFHLPTVSAQSLNAGQDDCYNGASVQSAEKTREQESVAPAQLVPVHKVKEFINGELPMDRLRNVFKRDHLGNFSPEALMMMIATGQATAITFMFGYWIGARNAGEYYTVRHQAAKYESRFLAMRSYYDAVVVGGLAHGAKYALKIGYFTGAFMLLSQSMAAYRNKSSPFEYAIAGALTAASTRVTLGLAGMVVSGVAGGLLGSICGVILYVTMSASGETQDRRHFKYIHERMIEDRRLEMIRDLEMNSVPTDETVIS